MKPPNLSRPRSTRITTMKIFPKRKPNTTSPFLLCLLLWFSLSLLTLTFLLSSPLFSSLHSPIRSPSKANSHSSHALLETNRRIAQIRHKLPTAPVDPLSLRIYIYDLPPSFNTDWLADPRCSSHLFASEVALHRSLLDSPVRTADPSRAHFFFVPVYVSCNFSTLNGFPSLAHARPLLSAAVEHVSRRFPFWNRSSGSDHLFVASHDFGACFHAIEDSAIAEGIPPFLSNSILLQTFGVDYPHPCQQVNHVLIPPYVPPEELVTAKPERHKRDIFAFFRGKMEVHPKNISGHYYSKAVRTEILRRYGSNRRFYIKRKRFEGFRSEIARSVFCLCPLGWAPWSPRLVESVLLGCLPVVIADGIQLPFPDAVPWGEISITVGEANVGELERVLDRIAKTNLTAIQRRLWEPRVRLALTYNRRMEEGDATWQVLRALTRRIDRSWRWTVVDQ